MSMVIRLRSAEASSSAQPAIIPIAGTATILSAALAALTVAATALTLLIRNMRRPS